MTPDWTPTPDDVRIADFFARRYGRDVVGIEPDDVRQVALLALYQRSHGAGTGEGTSGPASAQPNVKYAVLNYLARRGPTTESGRLREDRAGLGLRHEDGSPLPVPDTASADELAETADLLDKLRAACPHHCRPALDGLLQGEDRHETAARTGLAAKTVTKQRAALRNALRPLIPALTGGPAPPSYHAQP